MEESGEVQVIGAGLLPFSVDPECNRMYFWLGQERYNARWTRGSCMWGCFGGKSAHAGESAEDIAAREFVEETAGMMKFFNSDTIPRSSYKDISQALQLNKYLLRLEFNAISKSGSRVQYVSFLKQVPWDPGASRRFARCLQIMRNLPAVVSDPARRTWLLLHPGLHARPAVHDKKKVTRRIDGRSNSDNDDMAEHVSMCSAPCNPPCRMLCAQLQRAEWDNATEAATGPLVVDKDYFEKQALALWSLPQVFRAARYGGVLSTRNGVVERCRPAFIKHLTGILAELEKHFPSVIGED